MIALVINSLGDSSAKAHALLMKTFELSVPAVNEAIAAQRPVLQRRLFDRMNPEFPQKLLEVMERLQQLGSGFSVVELAADKSYIPGNSYYEVTPDRLRNMISAHNESLEDQRRFGELENGEG
jgi:hypothetical protein